MWLITAFGFFSVVEKGDQRASGKLTIRSRVREDLDALRAKYLPELTDTIETYDSDYRFRGIAPREAISRAFAEALNDIDYSNFKSEVARKQGQSRASVYHHVWSELYKLQTSGKQR